MAQLQDLNEQCFQVFAVALAETGDHAVIRNLVDCAT
jgi:hypothetical protein